MSKQEKYVLRQAFCNQNIPMSRLKNENVRTLILLIKKTFHSKPNTGTLSSKIFKAIKEFEAGRCHCVRFGF